jgi:hypothetical protein
MAKGKKHGLSKDKVSRFQGKSHEMDFEELQDEASRRGIEIWELEEILEKEAN